VIEKFSSNTKMKLDLTWKVDSKRNNHPLMPRFILGIVIGASGSGKTNCIRSALVEEGRLDYNRLYVFGMALDQVEYQIIKHAFDLNLTKSDVVNIFNRQEYIQKRGADVFKVLESIAKKKKITCEEERDIETFF